MEVEQCFYINGVPCELETDLGDGWEIYAEKTCSDAKQKKFIVKDKRVMFQIFVESESMDGSDCISSFEITKIEK